MSLKSTEELSAMTMKNYVKLEEELICHFKVEHEGFDEFWPEHLKVSKIFILMDSFWAKYIFFELKKVQSSYSSWNYEHAKVAKIFTLMGSFWAKYILFEIKKLRGVIFHGTQKWCKIWRKTDLLLGKWYDKFGRFSPEHLKVSKLEL